VNNVQGSPMAAKVGRERGGLEREVLAALAAAGEPRTAQQVLDDLDRDLAYTTVMTTLSRLHAKGALERSAAGRAFAYSLPGTPEAAGNSVAARRMVRLLDAGTDRASVLARFIADLSPQDEAKLTELLQGKED
jgi:predicted transcriptional regulator